MISTHPLRQRKVLVDGITELKMLNYGRVSAIVVPAGSHQILVTTGATPLKLSTFVFWIFSLGAAVLILRILWTRLATPLPPSSGVFPALRRWIAKPPFVRDFTVGAGKLRICEPVLGRKLDMKSNDGTYWRIESRSHQGLIAAVLVELSAPVNEQIEFNFEHLKLVDSKGTEFNVAATEELLTNELRFPNVFRLIDTNNPLLSGTVDLDAGETVRGYVVFDVETEEEYPFVHDLFAAVR